MGKIPITRYGRDSKPKETFEGILAAIEEEVLNVLTVDFLDYPTLKRQLENELIQKAREFDRHINQVVQRFKSKRS